MAVKQRKRTLGGVVFALLAAVAASALLLSCLAPYVHPTKHPLVMFFGLYFIPLFLLNILFLLIAIFRHPRALLITVVALLPTLLLAERFVKFSCGEEAPDGPSVKILTYNLGRYDAGSRKVTPEEAVPAIRSLLAEQDADIVCLQEFAIRDTNELSRFLPDYPYRAWHLFKGKRWFGNVTLSKYPIVEERALTFPQSRNLSLVSDIDVDGRTFRIYNCHLESYSISFTTLVKRLSHRETFTDEVVQVHGRLREATRRRSEQVSALLESETQSPWVTFLCGDFNDSPVSYTYHQLTHYLKDSFVEAGCGMGSSYSVLWPMLRVDYILLPQEFSAWRHETLRVPWSDHYPVTTNISLSF